MSTPVNQDGPSDPVSKPITNRLITAWAMLVLFGWPFVIAVLGGFGALAEGSGLLSFIYGGLVFIFLSPQYGMMLYFVFLSLGLIVAIALIVANRDPQYRTPKRIGTVLLIIMLIQGGYTIFAVSVLSSVGG